MPQTTVNIPGVGEVTFPEGMSMDQVAQESAKLHLQAAGQPKAPPQSTLDTFLQFSGLKGLKEAVTGAGLRAGQTAFDLTANERANTQGLGVKPLATEPRAPATPAETAGGYAEQLGELFVAGKTPAKAAANAVPQVARAGSKFEKVLGAAKDVPIDTKAVDAVVARAQELRQRGSTLPKVINDYIKAQKAGSQLTYEAGRDFASNASALSSREATALNSKMHRQVSQFADAFKAANREAAEKVGMGDLYDAAMKEYRQAKTLHQAADVLKKWGIRVGLTAAGAGALYGLTKGKE